MNIIKHIPNTITSMNLLCGVMGVIFTFQGKFDIAFYMMLAGALCDFCDGLAARALKAYSELGKQLDSLADMVSFGTLPALILHRLMLETQGESVWCYIPLLIAVFSALRLAKFNIDERQSENFICMLCNKRADQHNARMGKVSMVHTSCFAHPLRTSCQRGAYVLDEIQEILCRHSCAQTEDHIPGNSSCIMHPHPCNGTELGNDTATDFRCLHPDESGYLHAQSH